MSTEALNKFIVNNFLEHVVVLNCKKEISYSTNEIKGLLGFTIDEIKSIGLKKLIINSDISLDSIIEKATKYDEYYDTVNFLHKTKKIINISFRVYCREIDGEKQFVLYLKDNTIQNLTRKDIIKKSLTIENLSKSRKIRDGKLDEAVYEILETCSRAMHTTRVNAWIFDMERTQIQCIGNFDARENKLVPQNALPRIAMPLYFNLFETEKIIITRDIFTDTRTAEMYDFYLKPHNIQALMDIPIRIEGEMIGVICFENVGAPKEWTLQEQKFGLVAAQMMSLTIESYNKQIAKQALEVSLNEQQILLQEVHHRVKNNLSIISALMNLQADKSADEYHRQLFYECRNRLDSISSVHELIYKAKSYSKLNFKDYLDQILDHIAASYSSITHVKIAKSITDVHIDLSHAIPLALIVNELITNAYKHAFTVVENGIIEVSLLENNNQVFLSIKDDGKGFDNKVVKGNSIGMDIITGLLEQIDATCDLKSDSNGTMYKISYSKK